MSTDRVRIGEVQTRLSKKKLLKVIRKSQNILHTAHIVQKLFAAKGHSEISGWIDMGVKKND